MLTLKNLKVSETLSEESLAMTCDVYWNGRKFGHAKNRGHGEYTLVHCTGSEADYREATAHANAQPDLDLSGTDTGRMHDLSTLVDELAENMHSAKKAVALVKRTTKTKLAYIEDATVYTVNRPYSAALAERIRSDRPTVVVLNELSIEDAAKRIVEAERTLAQRVINKHRG